MLSLNNIQNVYFLGIGGIGMSALARYFVAKDYRVYGYDRQRSPITQSLEGIGVQIVYDDDTISLSKLDVDITLVVYTPAIPRNHTIFQYTLKAKYPTCKRSQLLGIITNKLNCLAVAGTHGKTTISSMLCHLLTENNIDCSAFLGGVSMHLMSNLKIGNDPVAVVEADEFDRSFLYLSPSIALISSIDPDHLDVYGNPDALLQSFNDFSAKVKNHNVIAKEGLNISSRYTYALNSNSSDFSAYNIVVKAGAYHFDLRHPKGVITDLRTGLPGIHNVENSLAAFAMAYQLSNDYIGLAESMKTFRGVKRRFEYHIKNKDFVYIDDYAHHPVEINMAIHSVRELYPRAKLSVIFQPHLFSRTKDFMNEFAAALSKVDNLILLDIYPARELPIDDVSSAHLLEKVTLDAKKLLTIDKVLDHLPSSGVLMTLGAGDIDQLIEPIKSRLII